MENNKPNLINKQNLLPLIAVAIILLVILALFLNPFKTINAGERGVLLNFGAVQNEILNEGLHFRIPIMQKVVAMDVKIQKSQTDSEASTKDLQDTHFSIVVNYSIDPTKVNWIYQNIGLNYRSRIIDPSVQEVVKAISAKYTAEELITKRENVSIEIKTSLNEKLSTYHIVVSNFSIVNFSFSAQFTQAIENKQTAEQNALKAERDLQRIEIEAKQKIEQAKAETEALRLKKKEISLQLLELRRIEAQLEAIKKWDGKLPHITSSSLPFLDLSKFSK